MKRQSAFTMVELLVTIVIIAVLALAGFYALNITNTMNKGADAVSLSDVDVVGKSVAGYMIATSQYPWNVKTDSFTKIVRTANQSYLHTPKDEASELDWLYTLSADNTIAPGSVEKIIAKNNLYILKMQGNGQQVWVCFVPESDSMKQEAANQCADASRRAPSFRDFKQCATTDGTIPTGYTNIADGDTSSAVNLYCKNF